MMLEQLTVDFTVLTLAAEASEGGPNLFAGSIWQSLTAIFAFLIVLVILAKFAWGPMLTALASREQQIRDDLANAEKAREEADAALSELNTKLAEAHKEAQRIVDESRSNANAVAAELKAKSEAEINSMKERAESDIESAKQQALSEIYAETANLATSIASKILKREINPNDHSQLVNESLEALQQRN